MKMHHRISGHLFIISGPSGAGKGTLRKLLFERIPDLIFSISCTTRSPREGELDGVDYHFIDEVSFRRMIARGKFLEWAKVHDNYYGTLREDVERELCAGKNVILEIDVQGAHQVKMNCPDAIMIFVAPPSIPELEKRLRKRGTEEETVLQVRLQNAIAEMDDSYCFDHLIVNDEVARAVNELENVIHSYE